MQDPDVLLLNMEVEAAAARNADLSREVERLADELTYSTICRAERRDFCSQGTQTDFDVACDVVLDLDDLLFEMAEVMFRLYPATPIDLSSRKGNGVSRLGALSQRCLREMRSLRAAWETKLDGYNKFIEELQGSLGDYYRSLERMESQLRQKELECADLANINSILTRQCADFEDQLKVAKEAAQRTTEETSQLLQRTTKLETEKQRLLDRESALANTVAALRAECILGPWKSAKGVQEPLTGRTNDCSYFRTDPHAVTTPEPIKGPRPLLMECGRGCHTLWRDLLAQGDAATLIGVFREALGSSSSDRSTLIALEEFLETHFFTAAMRVDLQKLWHAHSLEYLETTLRDTCLSPLDAREVLTDLLAIGDIRDGYALCVYLQLLRATLRQLLFDTLRRKSDCVSVEERLLKVQEVMRAWYAGGLDNRISHIFQLLSRRDALPRMVHTVKNSAEEDHDEDTEESDNDLLPVFSITETGTLMEALLRISLDILVMIGSQQKAVPLLLKLKAITVAAQPYNDKVEFLHIKVSDLRLWAAAYCSVDDTKTGLEIPAFPTDSTKNNLEQQEVFETMGDVITRTLLEIVPFDDAVTLLFDDTCSEFRRDSMSSITYEDDELGRDLTDTKVFTTLQDLKDEKEALRVLSDNDDSGSGDNDNTPEFFSLQRSGAMLVLCDLMTLDTFASHMVFSSSPTNFFFLSGPLVLESLKGSSLSTVMTGLVFLVMLLPHVPLYSVHACGEMSDEDEKVYELRRQDVGGGSFSFRTKKFEFLFELVKSLIGITATCPSESHRVIARAIFTLLIRRCAADLRMLIYSSFLVVTPFASICSLMLRSLSEECGDSRFSSNQSEYGFFRRTLPSCLLQAQENWLKKLRIGEVSFVDPIIQSLGFVRLVIAGDCRRAFGDVLFLSEIKEGKIQLRSEDIRRGGRCDSWDKYLHQLLGCVVPSLRVVVTSTSEKTSMLKNVLHTVTLTPLDCFSLTMALDGLEEHVALAPKD